MDGNGYESSSGTRAPSTLQRRSGEGPGAWLRQHAAWLALPGIIALVAEPLLWLARTWRDPSYQSDGAWVAVAVAALFVRSVASGRATPDPIARRRAWQLLIVTASIRAAGRWLDVNALGALALVVDIGALALLLGLARRPWAVGPCALAAFSALALPLEHLLQRLLGHPLQLLAAGLSQGVLQPFFPELDRHGTLLAHPAIDLAVDLPCSGARGLVLLGGLTLALLCRRRAHPLALAACAAAAVAGAVAANALRIIGLFLGGIADVPVIEQPWHAALGAFALAVGALPVVSLAARLPHRSPRSAAPGAWSQPPGRRHWIPALAATPLGLAAALLPHNPLDVSAAGPGAGLPDRAGAFVGETAPLAELERQYYARYGGGAHKRVYDDGAGLHHTALLVHTDSPLRHLHGPDRCLIGAGHRVTRVGVDNRTIPTVIYRSTAPDGSVWRVEASFVSDAGEWSTTVSQVVWHWLTRPQIAWNLVERISPWDVCSATPERCERLDAALFAALDWPAPTRADPTDGGDG